MVQHMPFSYSNKSAFVKYKLIPFMTISFGLPWMAIGWRWSVNVGALCISQLIVAQVPSRRYEEPLNEGTPCGLVSARYPQPIINNTSIIYRSFESTVLPPKSLVLQPFLVVYYLYCVHVSRCVCQLKYHVTC